MASNCYREERLYFDDPAYKKIRVSYVITMENSTRRASYLEQLRKHRPTSEVVILHNSGYKACNKKDVKNTSEDLWHANLEISKRSAPGEHVIIFEDDVMFLDVFRERASLVEDFVLSNPYVDTYNLGCITIFSSPIPQHGSHRVYLLGGAHAVIYSPSCLARFPELDLRGYGPLCCLHDVMSGFHFKMYVPSEPHASQPIPETENRENWPIIGDLYMRASSVIYPNTVHDGIDLYRHAHWTLRFGGLVPFYLLLVFCIFMAISYCRILLK
jgi:hypothetical protein